MNTSSKCRVKEFSWPFDSLNITGFPVPKRWQPHLETSNGDHCILSSETPGEPERSAVVSRVCPSNCCEILCHCCAVSPFPWAVSWLQFQRLWFHVWSDCYWAIALFGEFSSLIRILKGSSLVAGFLFLPMPYAWFPHTEEPLKSVEAQLTEVHCSAGAMLEKQECSPWFSFGLGSNWEKYRG